MYTEAEQSAGAQIDNKPTECSENYDTRAMSVRATPRLVSISGVIYIGESHHESFIMHWTAATV